MPEEKLRALYDATSQQFDLGDFDAFREKMQDPQKQEAFYKAVSPSFDLGDFGAFQQKIALSPTLSDQPASNPGLLQALGQRAVQPNFLTELGQNQNTALANPAMQILGGVLNLFGAGQSALSSLLTPEGGGDLSVNQAIAQGLKPSTTEELKSRPEDFSEELPAIDIAKFKDAPGFQKVLGDGNFPAAIKMISSLPEELQGDATKLAREAQNLSFAFGDGSTPEDLAAANNFIRDVLLDPANVVGIGLLKSLAGKISGKVAEKTLKVLKSADSAGAAKILDDAPEEVAPELERIFSANGIDVTERAKAIDEQLADRSRVEISDQDEAVLQSPAGQAKLKERLQNEEGLNQNLDSEKSALESRESPQIEVVPKTDKPLNDALQTDDSAESLVAANKNSDAVEGESVKLAGFDLPPATKTKIAESAEKIPAKVKEKTTRFREALQDSQIRLKQLQESPGVTVKEGANPYQAETLFHGRVGGRLEKVQETVKAIDKSIVDTSKRLKINDEELLDKVNRFLVARHAPERNAALGDGAAGMTTANARKLLSDLKKDKNFKDIEAISRQVSDLNKQTLDILRDGHLIDDGTYNLLRKKYKNHVPLNRIIEGDEDIIEPLVGAKGFTNASSGIKRAKGSDLEIDDILTNATANLREAITRSEKNRVGLNALNFVRNNPNLPGFQIQKMPVIGKRTDGTPILKFSNDPRIITVRENGKAVQIKIKDPRLATAIAGTNVNRGIQGDPIFSKVAAVTRFMSSVATRFNPEFFATNILRDVQEMSAFIASQKEFSGVAALKQAKDALSPHKAMRDIHDSFKGKNTKGAKLYEQMVEDGGTTGGLGLSTRKELEIDIDKIRKLNRSKPRQAAQTVIEKIDNLNTLFEDATRLTVYKSALDNGLSRTRAAELAKEATINFNRKGTSTPFVNGLYMFSNASIQGSQKMLKALKNPKVAAGVALSVGVPTVMFNQLNDAIDPDWREKVRPYDRISGLPIVLSSDDKDGIKYITIPVSWGLKPIKVAFDQAYDAAAGRDVGSKAEVSGRITAALIESYNPVGGGDLIQSAIPTIFDIPMDIARNKGWHGGSIRPENPYLPGLPEHMKYWKSFKKKPQAPALIAVTREAHETLPFVNISPQDLDYAIQQMGGGPLRITSKLADVGQSLLQVRTPDINSVPVVSRFVKHLDAERIEKSAPFRKMESGAFKAAAEQSAIEKMERGNLAEEYLERIKAAKTPKEKREIGKELFNRDQGAYRSLRRRIADDKRGLDYFESQLSTLEPAQKAEFIASEIKRLGEDEKQKLLDGYIEKKIIRKNDLQFLKENGIEINIRESIKRLRKARKK